MKRSLSTLILSTVIVGHAVVLPILALSLEFLVRRAEIRVFVDFADAYSRRRAAQLGAANTITDDAAVRAFLDHAVREGPVLYAALRVDGRTLRSALGAPGTQWPQQASAEDFGDGDAYFIATPTVLNGQAAELQLGFDESPTQADIRRARNYILLVMTGYLAVMLALGLLLARRLARPLAQLRSKAERIASGDIDTALATATGIREVHELGAHLDSMRAGLVGVNQRLQQQLHERSALENQLRQKQRVEVIGTMAGGLAHELNNVLVPILLYTGIALEDMPAGHPARPSLERARQASQRARSVVEKILAFGRRIDVGQLQPINLAVPVEEALRLFAALQHARVTLHASIDSGCAAVRAEPTLIVQSVLNLCSNALHALPADCGDIEVTLARADAGQLARAQLAGECVALAVRDTGAGMDAATRERAFDPYFTTREVGEGTGLGLSVVHGIVTNLGGAIFVDSEPGRGTTVTMLFPAAAGE
ncbi:MAG: HAMP domain-containing protein [Gammaproteobacteria bacterium]|nr:HAMP domain-containing protein [Gammaproteobacteria bacterium]